MQTIVWWRAFDGQGLFRNQASFETVLANRRGGSVSRLANGAIRESGSTTKAALALVRLKDRFAKHSNPDDPTVWRSFILSKISYGRASSQKRRVSGTSTARRLLGLRVVSHRWPPLIRYTVTIFSTSRRLLTGTAKSYCFAVGSAVDGRWFISLDNPGNWKRCVRDELLVKNFTSVEDLAREHRIFLPHSLITPLSNR